MNVLIMNLAHDGGGAEAVARQTLLIGQFNAEINTYFLAGRGRLFQGYDVIYPRRTPQKYINLFMCRVAHNQRFHDSYALHKVLRIIKKYKIDILHIHNLHGGYIGIDDIKRLSEHVKIVWTLHDMWAITGHCAHTKELGGECTRHLTSNCSPCPYLDRYYELNKDIAADCLAHKGQAFLGNNIQYVTPSNWLATEVKKGILSKESVTVINNGVDVNVFRPLESDVERREILSRMGIDENKIVLFFVAHEINNSYKGADVLIEALNKVNDKERFALIIAGKGEQLELDGFATYYPGYIASQEEMRRLYACADAFIIPSRAENYPCTVIEAMAAGTPVIGSTAGGIPEQISKDTGYIFENGNPDELALILNEVDKQTLNEKRVSCRERAVSLFSQENMFDNYIKLYNKVLNNA